MFRELRKNGVTVRKSIDCLISAIAIHFSLPVLHTDRDFSFIALEQLKQFRPDILAACEKAMRVQNPDLDFVRLDEEAFMACPDDSIDYAVMEKTTDAVVVPLDAGWSDVGS